MEVQEQQFSKHFKRLTNLGVWPSETHVTLHTFYQIFWLSWVFLVFGFEMVELFNAAGNLRKVAFNLCTSSIVFATIIRVLIFRLTKKKNVDAIRGNLWRDIQKFNGEEEKALMNDGFIKVTYLSHFFYTGAAMLLVAWHIISYFSYMWGPRELPFSAHIPWDTTEEPQYVIALFIELFSGAYVIKVAIEIDLAMFTLIVQLEIQYKILIRNVSKVNEIYEDEDRKCEYVMEMALGSRSLKKKMADFVKRQNTKELLKTLISRQQELIEYTKTMEGIYSEYMLVQLVGGSLLLIMNGLEMILATQEVSVKLCYQTAYIGLVLIDILFICNYVTQLSIQCNNVGHAVYSINWYKMDIDLQKTLTLMILRSQKPPKITAGKLLAMELSTYLSMLKNIYSWMMLFRQFVVK